MGFLRRILGSGSPTPRVPPTVPAVREMQMSVTTFERLRDDAALDVVGEAYRQENVASARPPNPGDLPPGLPPPPTGYYKALLFQEPTNQFDPNAIAIALWAGGAWALSGYLSRASALDYQPLYAHLAAKASENGLGPPAIACDAARVREGSGFGVVLHLGTPAECIAELAIEDRAPTADHPWAGKTIAITGQLATTICGVPLDRFAQLMLARWAGCEVLPRLTKKTGALLVADPAELTSNLQRAKDYGVSIVQEPDFLLAIGIPPEIVGKVSERWARR